MKNKKISSRINRALDVPREVYNSDAKIVIINFDEMLIENYKGVLEYQEFYVKIKTTIGNININGFNLELEELTQDDISIKGKIESVDLDRLIDEEGE